MWIERQGSGPAVLFVHGLGGTSSVWEPQVRALSGVVTAIRTDLNGSGRSPLRPPLLFDGWCSDLLRILDDQVIDRAFLVGHSMGTQVVRNFAAGFPDRVLGLVLVGVTQPPSPERRKGALARAAAVRAGGMPAVVDGIIGSALSETTLSERPAVVAFVREVLLGQDPEAYAQACEASADGEPKDVSNLDLPILLIAGRDDRGSPVGASEALARQLRRARVEVIERCGHWHTVEQPEAVTAALRTFLLPGAPE